MTPLYLWESFYYHSTAVDAVTQHIIAKLRLLGETKVYTEEMLRKAMANMKLLDIQWASRQLMVIEAKTETLEELLALTKN